MKRVKIIVEVPDTDADMLIGTKDGTNCTVLLAHPTGTVMCGGAFVSATVAKGGN